MRLLIGTPVDCVILLGYRDCIKINAVCPFHGLGGDSLVLIEHPRQEY